MCKPSLANTVFLFQGWLTFHLIFTVLGATDEKRKRDGYCIPPLIIAMTVATCIGCGFVSTGSSMNPAMTFGAAVVTDIWDNHWLYWVGPLSGSFLATLLYKFVFDILDNSNEKTCRAKHCWPRSSYTTKQMSNNLYNGHKDSSDDNLETTWI